MLLCGLTLTLLVSGCDRTPKQHADLILTGGNVITVDVASPTATTVIVIGDRIAAVGGDELLDAYQAARTVDLAGKTLIPGFIDSHIHIRGNPSHYIELSKMRSIAEIALRVAAKAKELGPGKWITGYGWSEDELAEQRRPLLDDLNAAAPHNPVMLTRAGGHSAVGNSLAFAFAGINEQSPDPDGGVIERDVAGRLNGVIRERQDIVLDLVPAPDQEELRTSLVANLTDLFAKGITSIIQAEDTVAYFPEWEAIYTEHRGKLPRAAVQLRWEGDEKMAAFGRKSGDGDEHLRVGAVKLFVDGGFTGPAAYTKEPYQGQPHYRGTLTMPEADLETIVREAHNAGWQLGIHAIGDAAIELTVGFLRNAIESTPRTDHRHYLNHFTVMPSDATMIDMAAHGIAITQQPNFTYTLEGRYAANLDGARLAHNNALRTPMSHGVFVAISSDILPIGPTVGLYAAVTRKGMSGAVYGAEEALTMAEALRGYTVNGAWLTREETSKGTIEPGKLADLVVLDKDPLSIDPGQILDLVVLQTYLGGRLVYDSQGADSGG